MFCFKKKTQKVEFVINSKLNKENFECQFFIDCYINDKLFMSKQYASLVECHKELKYLSKNA